MVKQEWEEEREEETKKKWRKQIETEVGINKICMNNEASTAISIEKIDKTNSNNNNNEPRL